MSTPEQLIPLTQEEQQILRKKRSTALGQIPLFAILAIVLLGLMVVFHTLYWLIAIPVFSLALAVRALSAFLSFRTLSRDLKSGHKQVISGAVEAQNMDVSRSTSRSGIESSASYRFWIQVKGKKLTVPEAQYYQYKKGDVVEAFIAPYSGIVFGINKEFLKRPFG